MRDQVTASPRLDRAHEADVALPCDRGGCRDVDGSRGRRGRSASNESAAPQAIGIEA
jgi:hypothetical protein